MKKVGILTLQYGLNYGGLLQCYALKEVLKALGYAPIIIDRIPNEFGRKFVLKRALIHPFIHRGFARFRSNELKPITKPIYSTNELHNLLQSFDGCIVGSDQVWRKGVFSVGYDYFLKGLSLPQIKISYAASFGVSEWEYDENETKKIKDALSKFTAVSVREHDGVNLLSKNCQIDAKLVLDPTLLASPHIYDNLIKKSQLSARGFIVTYILDWSQEKKDIVKKISNNLRKGCININPQVKYPSRIIQAFCNGYSVYDWLKLISSADYIITDSFHGTVFSIIFNRQFSSIGNSKRGLSRFSSLLKMLGIEDRLLNQNVNGFLSSIDYSVINDRLILLREESTSFITKNLK